VTLLEEAREWLIWILVELLKALAWGVGLMFGSGLCYLVATLPAVVLPVISSAVPLLMVGSSVAGAFSDWWDGRRPSTWLGGRGRATLVRQDDFGKLWTLGPGLDGEPMRVVEVVNRTPEPDGSYRHYFLRVPPSVCTAREAVAWTFGFESAHQYVLAVES
jgi:hypothetical protein